MVLSMAAADCWTITPEADHGWGAPPERRRVGAGPATWVRPAVPRWRGTGATMIGLRCSGPAPGKVAGGGSLGSGHGLTLDQKVGVRIPAARPSFACSSNKNRVGVAC